MKYQKSQESIKKFEGKTLLVLGSDVGSADMVRYARRNGAYTIVADNSPYERYKAKQEADDHALISTNDIDALVKLGKEKKVDGVLAGISEFNLLNAFEVSKALELEILFSLEQWNQIENKYNFRELCIEKNVPCPKVFYSGGKLSSQEIKTIKFPVMIKPVDASSSRGVFTCRCEQELIKKQDESIKESKIENIIVEEFVSGKEFTAHYTIINGKASLACVDNRYEVRLREEDSTTIPIARIYPSTFTDAYIEAVDAPLRELCESIGLKNGIVFVQGMYNEEENQFYVFEAGLRSAGEAPYRFISVVNNINAINILVDHVLLGGTTEENTKDDPKLKGKCCGVVSFATKGGTVGKIDGLEDVINKLDSIIEHEVRYPVGYTAPAGRTLRQLLLRFVMICENTEQMERDINYINSHISVLDTEGNNMAIKPNWSLMR